MFNSLGRCDAGVGTGRLSDCKEDDSLAGQLRQDGNPNVEGLSKWLPLDVNAPVAMKPGDRFEVRLSPMLRR
jgi:hypothetical protein